MTKFISRKTIAKKKMWIPNCRGSSCCHSFFGLIPLMAKSRSLLVIIHLLVVFFILDGIFKNNYIHFLFFFTFLHCGT